MPRVQEQPSSTHSDVAFNGHSMVGPLKRVLVCSPRSAGWNQPDRLARWQELGFGHVPDFVKAQEQHQVLCAELKTVGAEILELPTSDDLSLDAAYAHDASLATDFGLILMRPGKRIAWLKANTRDDSRPNSAYRFWGRLRLPARPRLATLSGSTRRLC